MKEWHQRVLQAILIFKHIQFIRHDQIFFDKTEKQNFEKSIYLCWNALGNQWKSCWHIGGCELKNPISSYLIQKSRLKKLVMDIFIEHMGRHIATTECYILFLYHSKLHELKKVSRTLVMISVFSISILYPFTRTFYFLEQI